jgi:hypothetical protein
MRLLQTFRHFHAADWLLNGFLADSALKRAFCQEAVQPGIDRSRAARGRTIAPTPSAMITVRGPEQPSEPGSLPEPVIFRVPV